jgi:hypothetical protein
MHLFSTISRPPTTPTPQKWPADLIEAVCIEAFGLTAHAESEGKWTNTKSV